MTRLLCLTLLLIQLVMPILAHDHGSGTHLHTDRLLPCHDEEHNEDHDHDAVYLPIAVTLEALRDAGPDVLTPFDVASVFDLISPPETPLVAPEPAPRPHRPPERPLFVFFCSLRC